MYSHSVICVIMTVTMLASNVTKMVDDVIVIAPPPASTLPSDITVVSVK